VNEDRLTALKAITVTTSYTTADVKVAEENGDKSVDRRNRGDDYVAVG